MSCTEKSFRLVPLYPPSSGSAPPSAVRVDGPDVPARCALPGVPRLGHRGGGRSDRPAPRRRPGDRTERDVHGGTTHDAGVPAGTVVVGVDGSKSADQALDWAIEQAALEHRPLTLVHALGPLGTSGTAWLDQAGVNQRDILDAMRSDGQGLLDAARDRAFGKAPQLVVHEVLRLVDPREALLDLSHDAAMIVLGSRGRGPVRSLVLGSVSVGVSRHASCPVVILRPHNLGVVRRGVLVGADGTERSPGDAGVRLPPGVAAPAAAHRHALLLGRPRRHDRGARDPRPAPRGTTTSGCCSRSR